MDNSKIMVIFDKAPWYKKMQALQLLAGWKNQHETAEKYGTTQRQIWLWNSGKCIPQQASRRAIARAHGLAVTDIFPLEMLKPDEVAKLA
ncbi:MAG: helix-turn-helix transcriptional regulator [Carboxydocellales bacterium]